MAVSGSGSGVGATLGDGSVTYAEVLSIGLSGINISVTDLSSAGSADQCADFLPGLIDAGFLTCTLRFGTILGTSAETDVAALSVLAFARTISTWTLTIPGTSTWACTGFIHKLGNAVHYKGGVQTQIIIKLTGLPAWSGAT